MPVTPENVAPHGEVLFSVFQGKKEASTTEEEVMPVMDGAGTTSGEYRHTQIWHVRREREWDLEFLIMHCALSTRLASGS